MFKVGQACRGSVLGGVLGILALTARETPEEAVFAQLHAKVSASFSTAQTLGLSGEFLMLTHPGFQVTKKLLADPYALSMLLDEIPLPSTTFHPSGKRVSDTYATILTASQTTNYASMAEREKALNAKRLIEDRIRPGKPTAEYAAYLKYQAAYMAAADLKAIALAEQASSGTPIPPGLDSAVDQALRKWQTEGFKAKLDRAFADLKTAYDNNVKSFFLQLKGDLSQSTLHDPARGPWLPVTATPAMDAWLSDQDWLDWTFQEKTPPSWRISVQLKRVHIARPWLDVGVFNSHGWTLAKSAGLSLVSTGNPADPEPGVMPLLITGLLLARHLSIQSSSSLRPSSAGLGPFSEESFTEQASGTQIIGFFCESVPRSPTPDPRYFR